MTEPDKNNLVPDKPEETRVTVERFTRNAIFAVGSQWVIRVIGLVSVTITARILTPEDFGLVSIAMSVVLLAELLTYVGVNAAIIRHPDPKRDDYDTAWTINLLANLAIAVVTVVIVAPVAANFFHREEMATMIYVLSLRFIFMGLRNIGVADFERNLALKKDFYMRCAARLVTFVITIGLAFYLRSFWALIIGVTSLGAAQTLFSYVMSDYRPKLSLKLWKHYLGFSSWMIVNALAQGLILQIERLTIGRVADPHVTGFYATSQDVARMFTWEIMTGLNRVTLPSFSKLQNDAEAFAENIATAFGAYAMFAMPLALGIAATVDSFVVVLLGEKWDAAIPFLGVIAIGAGLRAITAPLGSMLLARSMVKFHALMSGLFALIMAAVVIYVGIVSEPLVVAQTVVALNFLYLIAAMLTAANVFRVPVTAILIAIGRPCVASAIMYAAVISLPLPEDWLPIFDLLVGATAGAAVYGVVLLALWYLSGRPEGAEAKILREVSKRFG